MKLQLNGDLATFSSPMTIRELLVHLQMPSDRVAVVVNSSIIRKSDHDTHVLADGDVVEIITMVGGG